VLSFLDSHPDVFKVRSTVMVADVPLSLYEKVLKNLRGCVCVPCEAWKFCLVLVGSRRFVSKRVAYVNLMKLMTLFPFFWVAVTVLNRGDIVVPCAVELMDQKTHALGDEFANVAERARVCSMYCRFAVAINVLGRCGVAVLLQD
jgi:hypothetical protein